MNKDNNYWSLHKSIYMKELDKLDNSVINVIQNKPHSKEADLFNEKIEKKIQEHSRKVASL